MSLKGFSFIFILLSGCIKLPPITSCLYDEPRKTFHCNDPKGKAFDLMFDDIRADKLVSIPFQDFGTLMDYCERKSK